MTTQPRPFRRLIGVASALTVGAVLLSGCGAGSTDAPAEGSAPRTGGDLVFLIDSLGATWIPNNSSISSYQGQIWGNLTDKLVYVDAEGDLSPWIAQSWDENADKTQFTLHLKEGVTFSDGTPLDAAAVVANIDLWAKGRPDEGINRIGLFPSANYVGAEAVRSVGSATCLYVIVSR